MLHDSDVLHLDSLYLHMKPSGFIKTLRLILPRFRLIKHRGVIDVTCHKLPYKTGLQKDPVGLISRARYY